LDYCDDVSQKQKAANILSENDKESLRTIECERSPFAGSKVPGFGFWVVSQKTGPRIVHSALGGA